MVTRIKEEVLDDLDGTPAVVKEVVAVGSWVVELDLSEDNHTRLMAALAPFLKAGRKVKPSRQVAPPHPRYNRQRAENAVRAGQIRDWAKQEGISLGDRGQIPASVIEAYDLAQAQPDTTPPPTPAPEPAPIPEPTPEPVEDTTPEPDRTPVPDSVVAGWGKRNGIIKGGTYVSSALAAKYRAAHPDAVLERDARALQVTG